MLPSEWLNRQKQYLRNECLKGSTKSAPLFRKRYSKLEKLVRQTSLCACQGCLLQSRQKLIEEGLVLSKSTSSQKLQNAVALPL